MPESKNTRYELKSKTPGVWVYVGWDDQKQCYFVHLIDTRDLAKDEHKLFGFMELDKSFDTFIEQYAAEPLNDEIWQALFNDGR